MTLVSSNHAPMTERWRYPMGMFDKRIESLRKSIDKLSREIQEMETKKAAVVTPAARLAVDGMIRVASQRRDRLVAERDSLAAEDARQTSIPGTAPEVAPPGSIPGRKR